MLLKMKRDVLMPKYNPPIKDYMFLMYDLFEINDRQKEIFADYTPDVVRPILNEASKLACDVILPTNTIGDKEGCQLDGGKVKTPSAFKAAFNMINLGEWPSLNCDKEFEGQGIPLTIATAVGEFFGSANVALYIYHVLSQDRKSVV